MLKFENSQKGELEAATGAKRRRQKAKVATAPAFDVETVETTPEGRPVDRAWLAALAAVLLVGIWAYWPTLRSIVRIWNVEADYSHGYLVVPVAIFFLWVRRESFPGIGAPAYVLGLALLCAGLLARYVGGLFFLSFIDGYSILLWLAGAVALLGGSSLLKWSAPSIIFLFFMIPLPFGLETAMSAPLQRVATKLTCVALQTMGLPAFAEGNVVLVGEQRLEVAQACSGLRLFMTIVALAYAYVVLVRRTWWEKAILLAAIVPIAIFSNASRIIATGLLFRYTTGDLAHKFSHDFAGWAMIPLAAALFGVVLWYMGKLIREDEIMDMSVLVREVEH